MPGYLSTPGACFPRFPQTKEPDKLVIPQTMKGNEMAQFTVRVELHDADSENYEELHERMAARGYSKEITSSGKTYHLPNAEYVCDKSMGTTDVRDEVLEIAKNVKPKPGVLVTKSDGRAWSLSWD